MASGIFTADGKSKVVNSSDSGVHISLQGTFGGGTVSVLQEINKAEFPLFDNGTAITATAPDDFELLLKSGDSVLLELSGSTSPALTWTIRR